MYRKIDDFVNDFGDHTDATRKYLDALTDASLAQAVAGGHRDLGRIAWHLVQTIPEMMERTGLSPEEPGSGEPVPASAAEIAAAYRTATESLLAQIRERWTDEMYGSRWSRGFTLHRLMEHETHHRGQMSVLMRQAGLTVPGIMGPAKEEWARFGADPQIWGTALCPANLGYGPMPCKPGVRPHVLTLRIRGAAAFSSLARPTPHGAPRLSCSPAGTGRPPPPRFPPSSGLIFARSVCFAGPACRSEGAVEEAETKGTDTVGVR